MTHFSCFQVKFNGLTGLVHFGSETKSRLVERLDIVNVQEQEDENGNRESVIVNVSNFSGSDFVNRMYCIFI